MLLNFRKIINLLYFAAVFLVSSYSSSVYSEDAQGEEIADKQAPMVLAHIDVDVSELTLNQLRSIFSLRARRWQDGTPIKVVVLKDEHPLHKEFSQTTLKMLTHQLRRHWDRYIYSGTGQGPVVVSNEAEMRKKLKQLPGSIGYLKGGTEYESLRSISIR